MSATDARATADRVARRSYGKLVAFPAARTRDVSGAEDALADAFATALAKWPEGGVPTNPEAWLLTVARRKVIDGARRRKSGETAVAQVALLADGIEAAVAAADIPDRRLELMFACTHPAIDAGVRAPLMLQVVLGLDAKAIASAFLTSPASMAKRLVRAKEKIRDARIPFDVPERAEMAQRLDAVLDAIYTAFSEGWSDPGGTDAARRNLTDEALFLARLVSELLPGEAEVLGLLALMLHAEARRRARRDTNDAFVPLSDQDPSLWDAAMIAEAEDLLLRASELGAIGRFQLEGALQSAHVHRRRTGCNNWHDILGLYDALLSLSQSPVVALNRALAIAEIDGAEAGLQSIEPFADDPRLSQYQPYWAVRAELLGRVGQLNDARRAYELAIGLERDPAVRVYLQRKQSKLRVS